MKKSKPIKIFRPVGAGGASVKITANKKFIVGRKKERSILVQNLRSNSILQVASWSFRVSQVRASRIWCII